MAISAFIQWKYPSRLIKWQSQDRKLSAISVLTSFASDFDVISDWMFFTSVTSSEVVPPIVKRLLLLFCILGTIVWLVLASDGHVLQPLFKISNIPFRFSTGMLLAFGVLVEDLPQIILTFVVEDVYGEDGLSRVGIANILISVYDMLIKLAEAFDQLDHIIAVANDPTCLASIPLPDVGHAVTTLNDGLVAVGGFGGIISLLDLETYAIVANIRSHAAHHNVRCLAAGHDGKSLFSGSSDNTVRLWNLKRHTLDNDGISYNGLSCTRIFMGHSDDVTSILVISAEKFVTGSDDKSIKLWSINQEKCLHSFSDHTMEVNCLTTVNKSSFLSGSEDWTVKLWNIDDKVCIRTYKGDGMKQVLTLSVCSNRKQFITGSGDATIRLWDLTTGECRMKFKGHTMGVSSVLVIDSHRFLSGSFDNRIKLWNMESHDCIWTFHGHNRPVRDLANVVVGKTFVSVSLDQTANIWRVGKNHLDMKYNVAGVNLERGFAARYFDATTPLINSQEAGEKGIVDVKAVRQFIPERVKGSSGGGFSHELQVNSEKNDGDESCCEGDIEEGNLKRNEEERVSNHLNSDSSLNNEAANQREEVTSMEYKGWAPGRSGKYSGQVDSAKLPDGKGTFELKNGSTYNGHFKAGTPHGMGLFTWPNGDKYEGNFHQEHGIHGKGKYSFKNGDVYDGDYKNYKKDGKGIFTNGKTKEIYEGEFKNDFRNGNGRSTWPNGNVYEGQFRFNLPSGSGIFTWENGDKFDGNFLWGKRHGHGTLYKADGTVINGEWESDTLLHSS